MSCTFCTVDGGALVFRDDLYRVVLAEEPSWPGLCRVVLNRHVREFTDLAHPERARIVDAVAAVEEALRELLRPDKMNLASLGNVVPHLHWHVVPRWADDACFPQPIWSQSLRPAPARALPEDFLLRLRLVFRARLAT